MGGKPIDLHLIINYFFEIEDRCPTNLKNIKETWLREDLYFQKVWTIDISVAC